MTDAYQRTTFHGKPLDRATVAALKAAEAKLGYELTITQGIGGAAASAGTHTEGRAVDLSEWDHRRKVRVLRDLGFAAWWRPYIRGLWPGHIHAVLILEKRDNTRGIAGSAFRQIGAYDTRRDGLAGNRHDPTYRPSPPVSYDYPPKKEPAVPAPNHVTKARDALVEAAHARGVAASELEQVSSKRTVARFGAGSARSIRRLVHGLLGRLPKR